MEQNLWLAVHRFSFWYWKLGGTVKKSTLYISCWNFLLYFIWQSETRKICPLDLHFVENLNGKSPVRASPLSSVSLIWNSGEFFQKCKRFQTFKAVTCIVLGGSSFNKRSFTFFDPIILQARAHCAWNWINFLLLSEKQLLALFFTTGHLLQLEDIAIVSQDWKGLNLFCWFNKQARKQDWSSLEYSLILPSCNLPALA